MKELFDISDHLHASCRCPRRASSFRGGFPQAELQTSDDDEHLGALQTLLPAKVE